MLAGVLDAGVDGHGAVFALRRTGKTAGWGGFQWLPGPEGRQGVPSILWDEAGETAGGPGTPRKPRGALASGYPAASRGGMWRIQESGLRPHRLPEFTRSVCSKPQRRSMGCGRRKPGFTLQLHLFPIVWS